DVYRGMSEMELARNCYQQYLAIAQAVGNRGGEAIANHNLGLVALELGIIPDAVRRLKEALAQHKNMGELRLLSEAQCGLGQALEQLGQLDEAKQSYNAALDHCERIGHPNCEWQARYGLASCLLALGGTDEAREQLKTSIEIVEQLRDDLPESVNIDDFMRDKAKVFDLLQEIEGSEN